MTVNPCLPEARGPVSERLIDALRRAPGRSRAGLDSPEEADAWGEDTQLALYLAYEPHYRGFRGVDPAWEWDVGLHGLRTALEAAFLAAVRDDAGDADEDVAAALAPVLAADAPDGAGLSYRLAKHPDLTHLREYVVHRSVYHLKEADPHALLIPRLTGRAKAGVVTVEFDEYGGGRAAEMHAVLFADLMRGLGLDDSYDAYLDRVPGPMLAVVNLMSAFAWHRARRGMMVGHFAAAEAGTPPSATRFLAVLAALGIDDPACTRFFDEHVEADAVHEQLMRREVVGGLLDDAADDRARMAADIVFGIRAGDVVERRFAEHVLAAWESGRSSLRSALPV